MLFIRNDECEEDQKENDEPMEICIGLLREWNLSAYEKLLIHDNGYGDVKDWAETGLEELKDIGIKAGHARKLIRKAKEYMVQNNDDNQ